MIKTAVVLAILACTPAMQAQLVVDVTPINAASTRWAFSGSSTVTGYTSLSSDLSFNETFNAWKNIGFVTSYYGISGLPNSFAIQSGSATVTVGSTNYAMTGLYLDGDTDVAHGDTTEFSVAVSNAADVSLSSQLVQWEGSVVLAIAPKNLQVGAFSYGTELILNILMVPEPATWGLLFGTGALGAAILLRRKPRTT